MLGSNFHTAVNMRLRHPVETFWKRAEDPKKVNWKWVNLIRRLLKETEKWHQKSILFPPEKKVLKFWRSFRFISIFVMKGETIFSPDLSFHRLSKLEN